MLSFLKSKINLSTRSRYALLFCFLFGVLWGAFIKTHRWDQSLKGHLNLLVLENTVPEDIIESYRITQKVVTNVTYAKSEAEFLNILNLSGTKYDIATLMSNQVPRLIQLNKLMPIENKWIQNIKHISIDFKYPPYDVQARFTVPILWGVKDLIQNRDRGIAAEFNSNETSAPPDSGNLWTVSLGVISGSQNEKEAHKFINFLLDKNISFNLAKISKHSVTNSLVEGTDLNKNLKPSYIRDIPFRNLKYITN